MANPEATGLSSRLVLDGHKLAWHADRVQAYLEGERVPPITIDCALTRSCTYKCVYCYSKLQHNPEKPMTRDVIFKLLDDAAEIGVKGMSFVSDGESTCSPHLLDAVVRGRQNGLSMALGTNGYLLQKDQLLPLLRRLDYLRFNISAATPRRYAEIHGCWEQCFNVVTDIIRKAVEIKVLEELPVTIGMQMVLMPEFADQVLPLARLGKALEVDYFIIKHCSDDEQGQIGVDYSKYAALKPLLETAECMSTDDYRVAAKWSKIEAGNTRCYEQCYGPPLILQMSGSGLLAPCGMLFNPQYRDYHIGNIAQEGTGLKHLWKSKKYWRVMKKLASKDFNAKTMCGCLCLQHKVNEALWWMKGVGVHRYTKKGPEPLHVNFL